MKASNINPTIHLLATALSLFVAAGSLQAQQLPLTPVPDHFTEWTGAVDNDYFNAANWSTNLVPDGPTVAIRLPGDPSIQNKHIVANHTDAGDRTIQLYSVQAGISKVYHLEFSGNENGWLVINPIGKGFTYNGNIGSAVSGLSQDITYPESTGNSTNRYASYVTLNSYTRLTLDNSYGSVRVANSGLDLGVFTLKGNAEMNLSASGDLPFVYATGTFWPARVARVQIGGLQTEAGTYIYVGGREVVINSKMSTGEISTMGGVFEGVNTGNAECYVDGWKTVMTGVVNYTGDGRGVFRVRSGQYIVDGVHNGNIRAQSGAAVGGSGIINGGITVDSGGMFTPGERDTAPDNPLTVNASFFTVNGNLGFNFEAETLYDRLNINLTGEMSINGAGVPSTDPDSGEETITDGNANLIIGLSNDFPHYFPRRSETSYDVMTVNMVRAFDSVTGTMTATGTIAGDFGNNVSFPVSMSLNTTTSWISESDGLGETNRTLRVTFAQREFALPLSGTTRQLATTGATTGYELSGRHLTAAMQVDQVHAAYNSNPANPQNPGHNAFIESHEVLFDALNRQPSILRYRELLDQLTPTTYQSWFPSAIVRSNALVQSLDDRMFQDAAYARKKGSVQTYLEAYRQEGSNVKDELASYANYDTIASVIGADYAIGENFVAGAFLNYEYTEFDLDTAGGDSTVRSLTFGLNARYNWRKFQVNATAFHGTDDYTSKRTTRLATQGLHDWAEAGTDGSRIGFAGSIAYTINSPWFEITPVASLQWLSWSVDGFQERNGGFANLYVDAQNEASFQGKLGVRISRSFKTRHGFIRPFFQYASVHEFQDGARWIDYRGDPEGLGRAGWESCEAPGSNPGGYRLDAGLDWSASRKIRVGLRYHSEYRTAASENVGVHGVVNYSF
jgi:uncharacterized protein YhjY with autotransporter beta-barrel domain